MRKVLSLALLVLMATIALSAVARAGDKDAPQPIEVRVCPMDGTFVMGDGGGNMVHGKYKVYFCSAGCKAGFEQLSDADKEKRVKDALKKQDELLNPDKGNGGNNGGKEGKSVG